MPPTTLNDILTRATPSPPPNKGAAGSAGSARERTIAPHDDRDFERSRVETTPEASKAPRAGRDGDHASPAPMTPSTPELNLLSMSLDAVDALVEAIAQSSATALVIAPQVIDGAPDPVPPPTAGVSVLRSSVDASQDALSSGEVAPDRGAALALRAENAALRLVDRGLHALLQQRGGTLIMRLSPPELGSLEIRMQFDSGRVEVLFRASGAEASRLLEGNLSMLRQSLERHGVGVGRLAVEPPEFRSAEESARTTPGQSFDASGRESHGRQEAERELEWRTRSVLAMPFVARPAFEIAAAHEGPPTWPSSRPATLRPTSSPAATAS